MIDYVEDGIVGSYSPEEVFNICGLDLSELQGKVLADFGSGGSGFMSSLELGGDSRKYEIDPAYSSKESFEDLRIRTHDGYAISINNAIAGGATESLIAREREMVKRVLESSFSASSDILRVLNLSDIGVPVDFLFSISTVSTLGNPIEFLEEAGKVLSETGEIFIVEPAIKGDDVFLDFLLKNILRVKGVSVRKDKNISCVMLKIEAKALKRVITISKRFKK